MKKIEKQSALNLQKSKNGQEFKDINRKKTTQSRGFKTEGN